MLFTTSPFFLFFASLALVYFLLPVKYRRFALLAASYFFYMYASPKLIVYLLAATIVSYAGGRIIESARGSRNKKISLAFFITSLLGMLIVLKYTNFMIHTVLSILEMFGVVANFENFSFILPVGISFYTLQVVGYMIDVYRQKIPAEKNILTYSLFVAFFPQILSGPIARAPHLIPQFIQESRFDFERTVEGLKMMAFGFFKKAVIADRIAIFINTVLGHPHDHTGIPLLIVMVLVPINIFCDFSGYTDIATGAARILGINLMKNFDIPFHARSSPELWRRWHMSLSTWFRDYLYIPLGGSRVSKPRQYLNMFATFFFSGLWHGAAMTYLVWGSLCGLCCISSIMFKSFRDRVVLLIRLDRIRPLHTVIQVVATFLLVALCWIFFLSHSVSDAIHVLRNMFSGIGGQIGDLSFIYALGLDRFEWGIVIFSIFAMEMIHLHQENTTVQRIMDKIPKPVTYVLYYLSAMFILLFSIREASGFIYFQF